MPNSCCAAATVYANRKKSNLLPSAGQRGHLENISYGIDHAHWMTMALIIDDGLPVAGQVLCITTFATEYTESTR
jgi:hypothetical protein